MDEEPAYAFRPWASAKRCDRPRSRPGSGGELNAEHREAQQYLRVRGLKERLFHRFGELAGGGAGGLQLDQDGKRLLAERFRDQGRLVGPLGAQDIAQTLGLGSDAALPACALEDCLQLGAGQPSGLGRSRCGPQSCAESELHPKIRAAQDDHIVVTDGFSCRTQIAQGTRASPSALGPSAAMAAPISVAMSMA